jgi:aspartate--ammonia ligase
MYPEISSFEREQIYGKEKKAIFIIGIGDKLKSGKIHDKRSPDYDDWALNGDILIYDPILDEVIEISSMGIRVDEVSLKEQLAKANCLDRMSMEYHQKILNKELPYSIGGGIGQSRLLLLLLGREHLAEVQASSWEESTLEKIKDLNVL